MNSDVKNAMKNLVLKTALPLALSGVNCYDYSENLHYNESDFEPRGWNGEFICTGKHKQRRKKRRK